MQYSIAFAAVFASAYAATSIPPPAYGVPSVESHPVTTPVATTAPPAAKTSTAFVTDVETILSCGPEVTSCPGRSSTTAPATSIPKVTTSQAPPAPPVSTSVVQTTPVVSSSKVETTPVASSSKPATTSVVLTTPVATSSKPVTTAPATSAAPPAPPVPVLSTQAIETCVPTTIYKTVTVVSSSAAVTTPVATSKVLTTPVATTKAPYATGSAPVYGGAPSGTGVGPRPSTTAIIQQGAASSLQISGGLALVAAAALLF